MEHHLARDLLAGYVDDELEEATRTALEAHLEVCLDCRGLLDGRPHDQGADLPKVATGARWEDRQLRRAVRRTLLGTALRAAVIGLAGAMVLVLLWGLLLQPLVVARDDRVERVAQASWDLPLMFVPGAHVSQWRMEPTALGRRFTTDVGRYAGGQPRHADTFLLDLGVGSIRPGPGSEPPFGAFREMHDGVPPPWRPDRVPSGTVATVQLSWTRLASPSRIEQLVGDADASLLWAAFAIEPIREAGLTGAPWDPSIHVGYSTCQAIDPERFENLRWAGSSAVSGRWQYHGLAGALDQVRRATANLAVARELHPGFQVDAAVLSDIELVAAWLAANEPDVASIVVTGPTEVIVEIAGEAGADDERVLAIEFYNWEGRVC